MKNVFKLALVAAFLVAGGMAATASAQKFGYVNSRELAFSLPEVKEVETNLQKLVEDRREILEYMQVEVNKKVEEFQKTQATMTDGIRQAKAQEIEEAQQRMQETYAKAEEDLAAMEQELMRPVYEKAVKAVEDVMKAQGLAGVFDAQALVAIDPSLMVDVTPLAKKHLGVVE